MRAYIAHPEESVGDLALRSRRSSNNRNWSRVWPKAKAGLRAVFFMDAAHFVLSPFLSYLWSRVRVFIQAPSGGQRFNVLGALNALTHEVFTVTK